jgi:tetratricopeptide (TPR) repeat protein
MKLHFMPISGSRATRAALLVLCLFQPAGVRADELLDRAAALIESGQARDAYEILSAEAAERGGAPEFDLALGIAALEAGEPAEAVFALERVLAVEPDNLRARTELARAYFDLGENEAAQEEFSAVRQETLPPAMTRAIDDYLSAIDARFEAQQRRIGVYIEAAAGYDSNVNSATDTSQVAIPAFGNLVFTLDRTGRELDSGFFEVNAGTVFSAPFLRDNVRVFGGADLNERITVSEEDFRTRTANGQVGLSLESGDDAFLASLLGQRFYIDGDPNRDQLGTMAQWQHSFSERTMGSVFGQWVAQRFPEQDIRDVNQFAGGVGIVHAMDRAGDPIVYGSAYGGTDNEEVDSRQDIGRTFAGARVGGQYTWNRRTLLTGGVSYQWSRYGADDPLFLETREDHFFLVGAGLEYALNRNWSLRPEIQYTNNDSTLPINEFDRWQAFVIVRNDF